MSPRDLEKRVGWSGLVVVIGAMAGGIATAAVAQYRLNEVVQTSGKAAESMSVELREIRKELVALQVQVARMEERQVRGR